MVSAFARISNREEAAKILDLSSLGCVAQDLKFTTRVGCGSDLELDHVS